ncbi:MAG: DUF6356 family protein [Kiloniellales bacterium]|nr:DUF6356 family protein [Kiloniellales bacterium]
MLHRLFTEHPGTVNETYWEHMAVAGGFAIRLVLAALACAVHAVLPFLFVKTGSRIITELHESMVAKRVRNTAAAASAAPAEPGLRRA